MLSQYISEQAFCRCLPDHFSIRVCPSLSMEAAPSVTNGLGADAEFLGQSGSCTSENKMVQVCSVCQAHFHMKVYYSSISFITELWTPWSIPKQSSCWSETGILSAPKAAYSDQKPYKKGLWSFHFFFSFTFYLHVCFSCFPFYICWLFLTDL